jgi:hypothetical protein
MALAITYPTLSNPANKVEVETNFDDVVNKFGTIGNEDIRASAGIELSKLAASYQEVWFDLLWHQGLAVGGANWSAVGVSATTPLDHFPLPGSDADTAWVATDVSWVCTDTGSVAGSFDIRYGAYVAGTWTNAGSIITAVSMPVVGAGNLGNQGRALGGGTVSLTQSATVRAIALMSAGVGVAVMNAAATFLKVSVCLKRQIIA